MQVKLVNKSNHFIIGLLLFIYLMFTIIIFEFGPWPWPVENKLILYVFLLFNNFILLLFYYIGINIKTYSRPNLSFTTWYKISLIVSLLLLIPTSYSRTGMFIPDITTLFSDLGSVYFESMKFRSQSSSVIEYLRMVLSPFLFSLFPLTVYYWNDMKSKLKYLALLVSFFYILISVNMGINKEIVDYLVVFVFVLIARRLSNTKMKIKIKDIFKRTIIIFGIIILSFSALNYFQSTQEGRAGGEIGKYNHRVGMHAEPDSPLTYYLPVQVKDGVIALSSYVTQGYYGLSLSMQEPFTWTYGVGNSIFLANNIEDLFDVEIQEKTYPFKTIKYGWDPYIKWSSIYSWLASDYTFIGVFFIIGLIGFVFGICVQDLLQGRNFLSIPVFCKLVLLILYIPANNQIVQTGESFFGFFTLLAVWLFSRKFKVTLK